MHPLGIDGAWLATPVIHADGRGSFREWFTSVEFTDATGHPMPLAQANCSVSVFGAIRGIHFTAVPPGQAKYVTCAAGKIYDVIVDVRVGSPTFGKWESVVLDGAASVAVYLAEGLGHAWAALTSEATMIYLQSQPYDPALEHAISPLDPQIGIAWPIGAPRLSDKDLAAPSLAQVQAAGLLPSYPFRYDADSGHHPDLRPRRET